MKVAHLLNEASDFDEVDKDDGHHVRSLRALSRLVVGAEDAEKALIAVGVLQRMPEEKLRDVPWLDAEYMPGWGIPILDTNKKEIKVLQRISAILKSAEENLYDAPDNVHLDARQEHTDVFRAPGILLDSMVAKQTNYCKQHKRVYDDKNMWISGWFVTLAELNTGREGAIPFHDAMPVCGTVKYITQKIEGTTPPDHNGVELRGTYYASKAHKDVDVVATALAMYHKLERSVDLFSELLYQESTRNVKF